MMSFICSRQKGFWDQYSWDAKLEIIFKLFPIKGRRTYREYIYSSCFLGFVTFPVSLLN